MEFELLGWDEIMQQLEGLADSSEMSNVNKKVILEASEKAKNIIKSKFPKSKDNSKSGKKGYRPSGHFADNIPTSKIKKSKGGMYLVVGETNKNGEYFYSKFPEFGTSKQPPVHAFGTAREVAQKKLDELGVEEYSRLLQKKLDGR